MKRGEWEQRSCADTLAQLAAVAASVLADGLIAAKNAHGYAAIRY
jgi:hypothetical protein